jgi:prophage DNA circulation protein
MAFNTGYRQGSFNGAPFYTSQTSDTFGRRGVHHEFPYKNRGSWDDLGGKDTERQLELYVTNQLGSFSAARDALKAALEKGQGELVHPWLGRFKVVCTSCSLTHSEEELGVARFSATFIDADTTPASPVDNPVAGLLSGCNAALGQVISFVSGNFSLSETLQFVTDITGGHLSGLVDVVKNGLAFVDKAVSSLQPFVDIALKAYGIVTGNGFSLSDFIEDRTAEVLSRFASMTPSVLSKNIASIISLTGTTATDVKAAYENFVSVSAAGSEASLYPSTSKAATSKSIERIHQNQKALNFLFQGVAAIEAAKLIPYLDYEHQGQAEKVKDDFIVRMNSLLIQADDSLYRDLVAINSAVMQIISLKAPSLAKIGHKTLLTNQPSVVVAYEIYGGLDQEPDIVARNSINHPGFMTAGQSLEYLINA